MRSSNPNISNPLSRQQKRSEAASMALLGIVAIGALVFGVFYFTVHQVTLESNRQKHVRQKINLEHVSQPNFDGVENNLQSIQELLDESNEDDPHRDSIILSTHVGDIVIVLQPELSPESVAYIHDIIKTGCDRCVFYRAEKPGIFQGMIKSDSIAPPTVKGKCPAEDETKQQNCPKHDKNCGCHGPLMTNGMVGWAGGGTGPDFFIDTYKAPATHWGNQHTVWGKITDEESLQVITRVYELPATNRGGMTFLDENIRFTMKVGTTL